MGFEDVFKAEACIVRGPDLLWGGDIRSFHPPLSRFTGFIGGPPCQDFSKARRSIPPTGYGLEMLHEFQRCVTEAQPNWWLMENVDRVPNVSVPGYFTQRLDLNALECGSNQSRLRHFQFGSRSGVTLSPHRQPKPANSQIEPCATATEGRRANRRSWPDFCETQGLARSFTLPGFTVEAAYTAVGNGVPFKMAVVIAEAVRRAMCEPAIADSRLCACGCGRQLRGRSDQKCASPGCRKRVELGRKRQRVGGG
jgi:DNA (cytosine-5)-methyltransferase 1